MTGRTDDLRAFIARWRTAGGRLDDLRLQALEGLDDDAARRQTIDLFSLRTADVDGDCGEGLVRQQAVFTSWRVRRRE